MTQLDEKRAAEEITVTDLHETSNNMETTGGRFSITRAVRVEQRDAFGNVRWERRLRLGVRADPYYPTESRYDAQLWAGNGWTDVVTIEGTDPNWKADQRLSPEAKSMWLEELLGELLERALQVMA